MCSNTLLYVTSHRHNESTRIFLAFASIRSKFTIFDSLHSIYMKLRYETNFLRESSNLSSLNSLCLNSLIFVSHVWIKRTNFQAVHHEQACLAPCGAAYPADGSPILFLYSHQVCRFFDDYYTRMKKLSGKHVSWVQEEPYPLLDKVDWWWKGRFSVLIADSQRWRKIEAGEDG